MLRFNYFTHYLVLFICSIVSSHNKLKVTIKIIDRVTTGIFVQCTFWPVANETLWLPVPRTNRTRFHNKYICVLLGTFFCPSARFLIISWKSENLNFGHISLNLTHCAGERTPETHWVGDWGEAPCQIEPFWRRREGNLTAAGNRSTTPQLNRPYTGLCAKHYILAPTEISAFLGNLLEHFVLQSFPRSPRHLMRGSEDCGKYEYRCQKA